MSSKMCKNDVDSFCYVCGEFIKVRAKKFSLSSNKTLCVKPMKLILTCPYEVRIKYGRLTSRVITAKTL